MITVTKPDLPPFEKYEEYLRKIWESGWLTNNATLVRLLEERLQEYLGVDNVVLMCNGTLALQIAFKALELRGEVITTPFTFAATTNSLVWEGLTPVFADIDPETFNLDPKDVEARITEDTCAILPVHVYGNPCDVAGLQDIAERHNLKIIYDAAHAFGVRCEGRSVLAYGDMSILSFHATKSFNTIEGGAVVTGDEKLRDKLRLLRNHGIKSEEEVLFAGTNAKMNEFQAAMGLCNLDDFGEKTEKRKQIYERYVNGLTGTPVKFQKIVASTYNYSYMPVCLDSPGLRDALYDKLVSEDIRPRKYFYPLTPSFNYFEKSVDGNTDCSGLENASGVADRILCLPVFPGLEPDVVDKIVDIIKSLR